MSIGKLSKRIREIREENNKTIVVNLGVIDQSLEGLQLPFKIRPFNELLSLKANIRLPDIDIKDSLKTVPFRKLSASLQQTYKTERPDLAYDSALITIIDDTKNTLKFKKRKIETKILDCILHIDFNSTCEDEEGKEITLWQDLGLDEDDYIGALNIFTEVLNQEELIDCFEKLIECLKNKMKTEEDLRNALVGFRFYYELDKLPKEKQEEILLDLQRNREKLKDQLDDLEEKVKTELNKTKESKTEIKEKKTKKKSSEKIIETPSDTVDNENKD